MAAFTFASTPCDLSRSSIVREKAFVSQQGRLLSALLARGTVYLAPDNEWWAKKLQPKQHSLGLRPIINNYLGRGRGFLPRSQRMQSPDRCLG